MFSERRMYALASSTCAGCWSDGLVHQNRPPRPAPEAVRWTKPDIPRVPTKYSGNVCQVSGRRPGRLACRYKWVALAEEEDDQRWRCPAVDGYDAVWRPIAGAGINEFCRISARDVLFRPRRLLPACVCRLKPQDGWNIQTVNGRPT